VLELRCARNVNQIGADRAARRCGARLRSYVLLHFSRSREN